MTGQGQRSCQLAETVAMARSPFANQAPFPKGIL